MQRRRPPGGGGLCGGAAWLVLAVLAALPSLETLHPRHGLGSPPVVSFAGVPAAPELGSRDAASVEVARACPVCLGLSQVRAGLSDGSPASWTRACDSHPHPSGAPRAVLPRAPRLPGSGPRAPPHA
jgi:hypothetical protein